MGDLFEIRAGNAELLRVLGPTNRNDDTAITGATGKAYILDQRFDDTLTVALSSGIVVPIDIHDVSDWETEMDVLIWQGDGTLHLSEVSLVDTVNNKLTLSTFITVNTGVGRRVSRVIGPALTLVEFGTDKAPYDQSGEWGYRVALPISHGHATPLATDLQSLTAGQHLWVLYTLTGGSGIEYERLVPAIVV